MKPSSLHETTKPPSPPVWLAPAALAVFQAILLWSFPHWSDLNIQDEAQYMRQGQLLAAGHFFEADYAWSLPLSGLYAILQHLGVSPQLRPDVVSVALAFASTLALFWALVRLLPQGAAYLAACWWASSATALDLQAANTYVLGLTLVCLAAGLVCRGHFLIALAIALIAGLNRAEFSLWIALTGILWLVQRRRGTLEVPRLWAWAYAASGALLFALLSHGWRAQNRSWFAFRQHFQWGHPTGAAVEQVFPESKSIPRALSSNPEAFFEHVARNLIHLPGELAHLLLSVWSWIPGAALTLGLATTILAILGLAAQPRLSRERQPAKKAMALALLVATAAVLPVCLVLLPRTVLLLPTLPLVLYAYFGLATIGWRVLRARLGISPCLFAALLVIPLAAASLSITMPRTGQNHEPENRAALSLVHQYVLPGSTLLASQASELLLYAQLTSVTPIDPTAPDFDTRNQGATLKTLTERLNPDYLLDNSQLRAKPGAAHELNRLESSSHWRLLERRGKVAVFARE